MFISVKPTNPVLEIDNQRNLMVNSEQETPVVCSVAAARPAVVIRWYLGDNDVTASAETEETPTDTGVRLHYNITSTWKVSRPNLKSAYH